MGFKAVKYTTLVLNGLVWLGGSAMLGLGIWVTTQETEYKHLTGNLYVTIGYLVISSFVFIVGFVGACGILLLNGKLLKLYFALLLILFLSELGVAVYFYLERGQVEEHIQTNWNQTDDQTRILIQEKMKCCSMRPVILSHDSSSDKTCFDDGGDRLEDCYSKLKNWLQVNYLLLATSAAAVAVIQMFVLGGTCWLIADLKTGNRNVSRTKVVPMNEGPKSLKHRTAMTNHEYSDQEDAGDLPPEGRTQRKSWAKKDPKYEAVFSKM